MNTSTMLATCNPNWGFWGTMGAHAEAAWPIALPAIARRTACELEAARAFLDSAHGRHFADDVRNQLSAGHALPEAIELAIRQWMTWTINRRIEREHGIPRGLPYLTGWVAHYGLADESSAEA